MPLSIRHFSVFSISYTEVHKIRNSDPNIIIKFISDRIDSQLTSILSCLFTYLYFMVGDKGQTIHKYVT